MASKIAVYDTGHEIADTVAQSLLGGLPDSLLIEAKTPLPFADAHIAYGILRGTAEIFKLAEHWLNVDRGYFNPGHFDGYYRISYKGTQAKYDPAFSIAKEFEGEFDSIRTDGKYIMICPPTQYVCDFFNIDLQDWLRKAQSKVVDGWVRWKDDKFEIPWDKLKAVITFNSSVGWEAIRRGIPCLSNTQHSVVGSYYNTNFLDEVIEMFNTMPRKPLFDFMRSHQFTLKEIEQGQACQLINHYLSKFMSGSTGGKPSLVTSQVTRFCAGQNPK